MIDIREYGAVGNGENLSTRAIQAAIDECTANGGGRVVIPTGVYKCGTIWLKDHVELYLEHGARLLASDEMEDYNAEDAYVQNFGSVNEKWRGKHLIIAHEVTDVAISGSGTIDGNCYAFVEDHYPGYGPYSWHHGITVVKDEKILRPGQLICFIEASHIAVSGITVCNSPCWSIFFHGCEYVTVHGIRVHNPINMLNSDGLDIDSSRMVTVSDCVIETGDDCIAIRCDEKRLNNKEIHCEYITVTNCVFDCSASAVRVGVGVGYISHVRISNITVKRCGRLMNYQGSYCGRGCACIEDVNFNNISAMDTSRFLTVEVYGEAYVKNVTLENIRAGVAAMSYIDSDGEGQIENLNLRNIEIVACDRYSVYSEEMLRSRGAYLFQIRYGKQIEMEHVKLLGNFQETKGRFVCSEQAEVSLRNCNFDTE